MPQQPPPFAGVSRILVIKFKQIGDVLLAIPAVHALHHTFPDARIDFLLNAGTAPMVQGHPLVAEVIPFHRGRGKGYQARLLWSLRRRGYDLVADLSGGGDRGAIWSFATGAAVRIGTLPLGKKGMWFKRRLYTHVAATPHHLLHTVLRDLAILRAFGIDTPAPTLDLHLQPEALASARRRLAQAGVPEGRPYVTVHPTANWLFKCGDDRALAAAIDAIPERLGLTPVLTCGPLEKELERFRAVRGLCRTNPPAFAGDLTLPELAAVIAGGRAFLGVDSAPAHMAAALGVPVVVLFGPTGAYNWGPWPNLGGEQPYPAERGEQRAGRHTVLQRDWACVPCGKAGCDHTRVSRCLTDIGGTEMVAALARSLGDGKAGAGGP